MKQEHPSNSHQPTAGGQQDELPVDALGIPILNEVVELGPVDAPPSVDGGIDHPARGSDELQDYEILLAVVREHLKSQLEDNLGRITRQAVTTVVENATRNIEAEIERELNRLLDEKLSLLIDESLDMHLGGNVNPGE